MKKTCIVFLILLISLLVSGCGSDTSSVNQEENTVAETKVLEEKVDNNSETKIEENVLAFEGTGLEETKVISLTELKNMSEAIVEEDYFSLNSYGTKEYFHFKGVSLWHILNDVLRIKQEVSKVTFIAEDNYTVEYSIEDVKKDDYIDEQNPEMKYKMIIAWEENNKEYSLEDGNPFRLVVGQKEPGDLNKPNWVQNIKTITVE